MFVRNFLLLLAAACAGLSSAIHAEKEAVPPRFARFLPVGESPPFRQEIRDGVRYELDPPPESIPPREVVASAEGMAAKTVPLRLGRISTAVEVPAGLGVLDLKPVGTTPEAAPWLRLPRPETGDFMTFLWRKPSGRNWHEAVALTVPDGPLGAPAGTVRIVNLFPQAARIQWAAESLLLVPGKQLMRKVASGSETPFQILIPDSKGTMKRYFSSSVTHNKGERGWIVLYRADGKTPRRPLKVLILREPVVIAAPPPLKDE